MFRRAPFRYLSVLKKKGGRREIRGRVKRVLLKVYCLRCPLSVASHTEVGVDKSVVSDVVAESVIERAVQAELVDGLDGKLVHELLLLFRSGSGHDLVIQIDDAGSLQIQAVAYHGEGVRGIITEPAGYHGRSAPPADADVRIGTVHGDLVSDVVGDVEVDLDAYVGEVPLYGSEYVLISLGEGKSYFSGVIRGKACLLKELLGLVRIVRIALYRRVVLSGARNAELLGNYAEALGERIGKTFLVDCVADGLTYLKVGNVLTFLAACKEHSQSRVL